MCRPIPDFLPLFFSPRLCITITAVRMECNICRIVRPATAKHCYTCGTCVDHVSGSEHACLCVPFYLHTTCPLSAVFFLLLLHMTFHCTGIVTSCSPLPFLWLPQMDHHCPFTGKCIARKNYLSFQVFAQLVGLHTYVVIGASVYYLVAKVVVPSF